MRMGSAIAATAFVVLVGQIVIVRAEVVIETVTVGNPGNDDDTRGDGYGGVDYVYSIGTYEVTAGQYTEFLNAVAGDDAYRLYDASMWTGRGCQIERTGESPERANPGVTS